MDKNIRINKLTGEPVSEEMKNVLSRLSKGENVPIEEIREIKEIREATAKLNGMSGTPTYKLQGREEIQNDVFNALQNAGSAITKANGEVDLTGEIRREKRLDIVIGLPAAGKSSALAEPLSELYKSRIIDSDEAKKLLPEYNNGWGAGIVHDESTDIADRQMQTALKKGENIVYPRVGGNCKHMKKYISDAKKQGYKVYVHYNELDRNKALGRMMERFLSTGRYIQPELISKYGDSINNTYTTLKNEAHLVGGIDGYTKWSNDVPLGERPIPIEHSASCEEVYEKLKGSDKPTYQQLLQLYEKNKGERDKLYGKVLEVNEVFKKCKPETVRDYCEKRDELRGQKNKQIGRGDNHQPPKNNPKKPKR